MASCCDRPVIPNARPAWLNSLLFCGVVGCGVLEGIGFLRSGVIHPLAITNQMTFDNWIVMKMFLAALGTSMVVQSLLAMWDREKWEASRVWKRKEYGYKRAVVGCALLGVGMTLSGSGPTMLPPQIGAGVQTAFHTFGGMLLGASAFAWLEKRNPEMWTEGTKGASVDGVTGIKYEKIALPCGAALLGAAAALEALIPFRADAASIGFSGPELWAPMVGGAIVGLNQIPLRLIASHGQGGSSAVMAIVSTLTGGYLAPNFQLKSFAKAWQFAFVYLGSTAGAYIAGNVLYPSGSYPSPEGFSVLRSVLGGFFMLFGARLAGGCTCGHGISGSSELGLESLAGTAAIFGGAIGTAVAGKHFLGW